MAPGLDRAGTRLLITGLGVVVACTGLAAVAILGPAARRAVVPALPHLREIAVLSLLGAAGAAIYGLLLLATLHLFGLRLRRA